MKKLNLTLIALISIGHYVLAQDQPLHNQQQNTAQPRGGCIEVLNTSQFFAGEFGGGQGTGSICFEFPSTCGAEIHLNSNHVVDFLQFTREDGIQSGIIGVGKTDFNPIQNLSVGEVFLLPFVFSPPVAFEGPIQVDVSEDGFVIEKLSDGYVGDMFVNADLYDFTATVLSNTSNFTNWSVDCKPAHICLDYQGLQYSVACPNKDLYLRSKCFESGFVTTWVNPFSDTIISQTDTLHLNPPVAPGVYTWFTPCNKGYVVVYDPDSVKVETRQVFCSSKQKIFLPTGLKGNWSTGTKNTNYVYVSQPGWYFVTVSDCVTDSIFAEPKYQAIDLQVHFVPDVDTVLFTKDLEISTTSIANVSIQWYKDGGSVGGYVRRPGFYTIVGTLDECWEYDTLLVIPHLFSECDWPVYGPNVFSPDGDGSNDEFSVFGPNGSDSWIEVYDRWGELIFRSTKPNQGWDGTYKGVQMNPAVFMWRARIVNGFEECNSSVGSITLIR